MISFSKLFSNDAENVILNLEYLFYFHHVGVVLRGIRTSIGGKTNQKGTNLLHWNEKASKSHLNQSSVGVLDRIQFLRLS